jgi:glycosyltransferase involved in cell wall biosynthesis
VIETCELDGIKIVPLRVAYSQKMGFSRRLIAFALFVVLASWVAARVRGVDVIFATSTPLTIAIPAIVASWIRRRPFVFEVRDLWPEVPVGLGILRSSLLIRLAEGLERLAYRCARHIVALSPGIKQGIVMSGVSSGKVSVIPNACDNDLFDVPYEFGKRFRARHPHFADRPLVVYAGAFGMANGLDYFVRLADLVRLRDSSIAFLLVGHGKERDALLDLARKSGVLNDTLWIMDDIPRQNIPDVLSAATIATSIFSCNPVLRNNSANKFFDALAAGRPVAINYGGWQADLLTETGAGIVLPPDDIEKAAEILVGFLHSESRLAQARKAARVLAQERFDRRLLANQLEEVLQSVVAR